LDQSVNLSTLRDRPSSRLRSVSVKTITMKGSVLEKIVVATLMEQMIFGLMKTAVAELILMRFVATINEVAVIVKTALVSTLRRNLRLKMKSVITICKGVADGGRAANADTKGTLPL